MVGDLDPPSEGDVGEELLFPAAKESSVDALLLTRSTVFPVATAQKAATISRKRNILDFAPLGPLRRYGRGREKIAPLKLR